jgi:hypothetical protein
MMRLPLIACLLFSVTAAAVSAQTILGDIARREARGEAPGEIFFTRIVEVFPADFKEVARRSDVIFHGQVTPIVTQPTTDGRALFTDYSIVPTQHVLEHAKPSNRSNEAIVIRQWGGTLQMGAWTVVVEDSYMPNLKPGTDYILMLKYNDAIGRYEIAAEGLGAFLVQPGGVKRLMRGPRLNPDLAASPSDFITAIHEALTER